MTAPTLPTAADIGVAADRIAPYARRTPILRNDALDEMVGAQLFFKCENLQHVGAFKFRGACNAVFALDETRAQAGVATHSSGNHAAALALAARLRGVHATIVMPEDAPNVKKRAVAELGAEIVFCAPTQAAREAAVEQVIAASGATLVHPYNDFHVICGQGTAARELLEDFPNVDALVTPVGGGGLLSGTVTAATGHSGDVSVLGAEPATADDAFRSFQANRLIELDAPPKTIADGLRTSLGPLTFDIIRSGVTDILRTDEDEIRAAMRLLWERLKIVVEPSGAVPLAALLANPPSRFKRIGVIISGGNVDLDRLPWRD
ncbi:MAG: pyridoxal-phosphate dependent enzyme [Gammaproteobacteria bacterium]|nr:pyridoxal-phosphate dependent enzyme [Gammaproteobacteria bacterium]